MSIPFKKANILVPKAADMTKWSVVACDQYTSEPAYWEKVESIVGDSPSTLKLTLPEIYLESDNVEDRISKINENMKEICSKDFFNEYKDSIIYLERTQSDGKVREGLIGMVDLEDYDYSVGSKTLIRATEKTVIERIPPRVKVRENALLELPHIMILFDDEKKEVIEPLKNKVTDDEVVYDFELMQNGGHIKGYKLSDYVADQVLVNLEKLSDKDGFEARYNVKDKGVLLFAMGDGNHSLATAKACYEKLKTTMTPDEYLNHPARYALVELVNLHSDALEFEAIHRVVFDVNVENLIAKLDEKYNISDETESEQYMEIVTSNMNKKVYLHNSNNNIVVGSLQVFLDEYLKEFGGKIDYIHGEDVTKELGSKENNIGFILPAMGKNELFKTVTLDGALPRKTFSMGHSYDKRYYLEARKIK